MRRPQDKTRVRGAAPTLPSMSGHGGQRGRRASYGVSRRPRVEARAPWRVRAYFSECVAGTRDREIIVQQSQVVSEGRESARRVEAQAQRALGVAGKLKAVVRERGERLAERIGQQQIPKVLDRRESVARELRAIPQRIQKLSNQASLVLELIDDFRAGRYREVPWRSIAIAAGALLYSVSPGDVVPDVVPLVGSIDDAIVLGVAMRLIRGDLERYLRHKGYSYEKYFD